MRSILALAFLVIATQASASCSIVQLNSCTTEELCERGVTNYNDWRDRTNNFLEEAQNRGVDCRNLSPSPTQTQASTMNSAINCATLGEMALLIMQNRQAGASLSGLMETANGDPLLIQIILTAYEAPRWSTPANMRRAEEDFSNDVMLDCYRAK
jgi:hypothetical protein